MGDKTVSQLDEKFVLSDTDNIILTNNDNPSNPTSNRATVKTLKTSLQKAFLIQSAFVAIIFS